MLRTKPLVCLLVAPLLGLAACGGGDGGGGSVDTASYTCAEFNKSLRTKGDDTSGEFINKLVDQADLGQEKKVMQREITLGVYFACRNQPGSTKPATKAIATAKLIKAGKFKLPSPPKSTKTGTSGTKTSDD